MLSLGFITQQPLQSTRPRRRRPRFQRVPSVIEQESQSGTSDYVSAYDNLPPIPVTQPTMPTYPMTAGSFTSLPYSSLMDLPMEPRRHPITTGPGQGFLGSDNGITGSNSGITGNNSGIGSIGSSVSGISGITGNSGNRPLYADIVSLGQDSSQRLHDRIGHGRPAPVDGYSILRRPGVTLYQPGSLSSLFTGNREVFAYNGPVDAETKSQLSLIISRFPRHKYNPENPRESNVTSDTVDTDSTVTQMDQKDQRDSTTDTVETKDQIDPTTDTEDSKKDSHTAKQSPSWHHCSVCLEEYIRDEELITLPCFHVFHETCVTEWLEFKRSCPLCRFSIL